MSRNEKQLKEIIKTLGGTYSENDNCTCELLGRVNEAIPNIMNIEYPTEIITFTVDDFVKKNQNGGYTLLLDNTKGEYNNKRLSIIMDDFDENIDTYIYINGKKLINTEICITCDNETYNSMVTVRYVDIEEFTTLSFNSNNSEITMPFIQPQSAFIIIEEPQYKKFTYYFHPLYMYGRYEEI